MNETSREKNVLWVLFVTIFIDLVGYGILIPIIPQLFANPASPDFILPQGFSVSTGYILLGLLIGIFPLAQFLATPILGQLSDKFGRKKLLGFSLAGTCLSYLVFAFGILTRNLPLLFAARFFDGITGGNISVAQAAIADITLPEHRSRNFGLIGAAFGLGFILGPYLGGQLSDPHVVSWFNAATPFWFAAALSFLNIISLILFLPETNMHPNHALAVDLWRSVKNIVHAFNLKPLRPLFTTSFIFQAGFAFYIGFGSVFLINRFGFTQSSIGNFFAYVGIWIAFTQAVITRFASRKFREHQILRVSMPLTGIALMLYFVPTVWWGLLFVAPFLAMGVGLTQANIPALVSRSAGPAIQGEVLGIGASVQALGTALPPMLSGFIAAKLTPETPLIFASVIILFAALLFTAWYRPAREA